MKETWVRTSLRSLCSLK